VACLTASAAADDRQWRVVSVHDGDTVTALDEANAQHRIRLAAIDAPESGQPFGTVARDRLASLAKGRTVTVRSRGNDRYGRLLADVSIGGDDLARRLLVEGLAWHYSRFDDRQEMAAAEVEARTARRGLWADPKPVPPWEWRATEAERKQAVPAR
jgi:endonuclease YncB( thermonuclease family)